MRELTIGIQVLGTTSNALVDGIIAAEQAGIDAVWIGTRPLSPDPLAVYCAAAMSTDRILFGTCIVPIFPRHPLAMAQGAIAVDSLAPGRLRLGVGPSDGPTVEQTYGVPFDRPLVHLREYLEVLSAILTKGTVAHNGERLIANATLDSGPTQVKVMAAALSPNSVRLAGELTSGVIPWMCPPDYLREVITPAIHEGAQRVGREAPPLVAHVPLVVSNDVAAVRNAARSQLGHYPRLTFYARMFQRAGFEEATRGELSNRMIDAIVTYGSPEKIHDRLRSFAAAGASEVIVSPLVLAEDPDSHESTVRFLGELCVD